MTKTVRVGVGSGVVIRIYGSAEPEPKEIFMAPPQLSCQIHMVFLLLLSEKD